jgi:hypothetical protein
MAFFVCVVFFFFFSCFGFQNPNSLTPTETSINFFVARGNVLQQQHQPTKAQPEPPHLVVAFSSSDLTLFFVSCSHDSSCEEEMRVPIF